MPFDELQGVTIDQIGRVALLFRPFAAVPPVMLVVVANVADEVDIAAVLADELVEAVILRVIIAGIVGDNPDATCR